VNGNQTAVVAEGTASGRIARELGFGQATFKHQARRHYKRLIGSLLKHALLLPPSMLFLFPLVWMLSTSLKADQQILIFPPVWIPDPIMWSNYPQALTVIPFVRYLSNTLVICILTVVGTLLSNVIVAYGFARMRWRGRDALFFVILATMMLPYQVTMIPVYLIFNRLHWINTFKPLVVPAYFGDAFYIFLLRQFMMGIPRELSDAAYIDGASERQQLVDIVLPLCKPALATVALFQFLGSWNWFLGPLIYLNDKNKFTIALGLAMFQSGYGLTKIALIMAASTVTVLPIIILFFFTQRTFIQGITFTGLKG